MGEVHVIGEILGADGFPSSSLFCKWEVVAGEGWQLLEGDSVGQTQVDDPQDGNVTNWCHPVDIHYRTIAITGWPKFKIQVWHHDYFGRNELYGYGFVHIPTKPGIHELEVVTWRPKGSNMQEITAYFLGGTPQLVNDGLIVSGDDRHRLKTVPMGKVFLSIGVLLKDFEQHNVLI